MAIRLRLMRMHYAIKKNYVLMDKHNGRYYYMNNSANFIVDILKNLFNDQGCSVEWFLSELIDPNSRGISGELTVISIKGDKVLLEPTEMVRHNPEDYIVEIDRSELIRVASEWQALVDRDALFIYIYHHNNRYFVSDTLPQGIECCFSAKQLGIKKKYIQMSWSDGFCYNNMNDSSNAIIHALSLLFCDCGANIGWFIDQELLNPTCVDLSGSFSYTSVRGDKVILKPSLVLADNPDDYAVEIDRSELIRLAQVWRELVKKQAPFIYIYCQNNKYSVSETLPEGIE